MSKFSLQTRDLRTSPNGAKPVNQSEASYSVARVIGAWKPPQFARNVARRPPYPSSRRKGVPSIAGNASSNGGPRVRRHKLTSTFPSFSARRRIRFQGSAPDSNRRAWKIRPCNFRSERSSAEALRDRPLVAQGVAHHSEILPGMSSHLSPPSGAIPASLINIKPYEYLPHYQFRL